MLRQSIRICPDSYYNFDRNGAMEGNLETLLTFSTNQHIMGSGNFAMVHLSTGGVPNTREAPVTRTLKALDEYTLEALWPM